MYATARKPETLEGLKAKGCRTLALDVTSEDSMTTAVKTVLDETGRIDALVNNAGYSQSGAAETLDLDDVRRQFETNVFGLLRMSQLVLPAMREQGSGRIVNISSMGGRLVFPGGGIYHATKYAVEALSDAMRFEVAGFGVQVVIVEPGLITTNFENAAVASMDGQRRRTIRGVQQTRSPSRPRRSTPVPCGISAADPTRWPRSSRSHSRRSDPRSATPSPRRRRWRSRVADSSARASGTRR